MSKTTRVRYKCPSCKVGKTEMKKIHYELKTKGGKTIAIPDLEVEECSHCGERIFSLAAARRIEAYKARSGRLVVRLKPETHAQLAALAKKHRRSLNQEINFLLEESLRKAS